MLLKQGKQTNLWFDFLGGGRGARLIGCVVGNGGGVEGIVEGVAEAVAFKTPLAEEDADKVDFLARGGTVIERSEDDGLWRLSSVTLRIQQKNHLLKKS